MTNNWLGFTAIVSVTVFLLTLIVSAQVKSDRDNARNTRIATACVESGGDWTFGPSGQRRICVHR